jgi:hypothetical protein
MRITRVLALLLPAGLALASCDSIVGIHDHALAPDAATASDVGVDGVSPLDSSEPSETGSDSSLDGAETDTTPDDTTPDDTTPEDAGPTINEACTDRSTAFCKLIERCSPALLETDFGSMATCTAVYQANCENSLKAAEAGGTPENTEQCASAYSTYACDDFFNNVNTPAACIPAKGTRVVGKACAFPGQCESGFCAIPPNAACGTCSPPPVEGDSCAKLSTCGPGLICWEPTKTCLAYVSSGAACSSTAPCGAGLSCVGAKAATSTPGTCQSSVTTMGAACDATLKSGPACDLYDGLTCNTSSKQCETLAIVGAGQACGTVADQLVHCAAGGTCTAMGDAGSRCVGAPVSGGSCEFNGPACISPQRCVGATEAGASGTCQVDGTSSCP